MDNEMNDSKESNIVVKGVTAPEKAIIKEVTDKSTYVIGEAEPNTTVIIYVESKEIARSESSVAGSFKLTIPVQKAGTVIEVKVMDRAGNVSDVTDRKRVV